MTHMPDAGRSAANVLLDAVIALDPDSPDSEPIELALKRLDEIPGAYDVTVDDDGTNLDVKVDLSNLLGGAVTAMQWLVSHVADAQGVSREEVVSDLRAWLAESR
jgi:hypothetical protein